ncbi:MAG: antitoxin [Candidatus Accumulibacter sp.]|jgi:hypothetical protein|nr:antitoxin [Accumulibacter sp.]
MSAVPSPLVSEFETAEQETSHAARVRTKVSVSLADTRPTIPHDEVMAGIDAIVDYETAESCDIPPFSLSGTSAALG